MNKIIQFSLIFVCLLSIGNNAYAKDKVLPRRVIANADAKTKELNKKMKKRISNSQNRRRIFRRALLARKMHRKMIIHRSMPTRQANPFLDALKNK